MIRLKKYLNPHENNCSKVISILITGNSLHKSSSAPQQHNSAQYKWLLCTYTEMFRIQTCCNHILSAAEGGNMRGSRIFCQFNLVLSLFYSLQGGPMVLLLRKVYLYFTKDPEGVHYFPGGGVPLFPRGGGGSKCQFL